MTPSLICHPLICHPIGHFHGVSSEKYMAPRQAKLNRSPENGHIVLLPSCNFEQALVDLNGFEHVWILYWFNRNSTWKVKVSTPRGGIKRGVFATRSPHRPNPIGLSCVELLGIKGRTLHIGASDLLDKTPILDIKPYLTYADAFPLSKQGWIQEPPKNQYRVEWSQLSKEQGEFIELFQQIPFFNSVSLRLENNPFPFKNHRIKWMEDNQYELAFKTWRLTYLIEETSVKIIKITSGYDEDTLLGYKTSRWNDVPIHHMFLKKFP